jgi:predicted NAD/FAD-dependent oxidoreductase
MKVIVVGAGLAGLVCAKVLTERGYEIAGDSSINGSMLSGEKAAREAMRA